MATAGRFRRDLLPPARAFYQREFGSALGKERRDWAPTKCCFHDGHSKTSLNLNMNGGGYYCFSCGARGGDLVAFVRQRYSLSFVDACRELGCWDEKGATSKSEIRRQRRARAQQQAEAEAELEGQRQARIDARNWLHLLERVNRDAGTRLTAIRAGAPEAYCREAETLWSLMADSLDLSRTAAIEYAQLAGVPAGL